MDYVKLGKRIRYKRLELEWTQERLAEEADISPAFLGNIERGRNVPSLETLLKITNALKCDTNYLLQDSLLCREPDPQDTEMILARLKEILPDLIKLLAD